MICVRHGRTAWNAEGRFQGIVDIPLDDIGREQVRSTAVLLREIPCDYAVSSDLSRARETLQIVLEGRSLTAEVDAGFRERDFGAWEGLTWKQIVELVPALGVKGILDVRSFQPENGEHFSEVKVRVRQAYTRALEQINEGQTVVVVAHAGVLHALLDDLFGAEREATMIPPAGAFALYVHGDEARFEGIAGM